MVYFFIVDLKLYLSFNLFFLGLIGLALAYALSITSLLNGTITAFTETEKEIVSVERVMQYIDVETEDDTYLQLVIIVSFC